MNLKSLYEFQRAYFNYPTSGNVSYARAISDTMKVTRQVMLQKSISPIQKYLHFTYSRKVTKDMLLKLVTIAMRCYQDPFNEIQYFKILVSIDNSFINTHHRGINVPLEGGLDVKNNKLIILTFSKPDNMKNEIRVIKGLLREFPATVNLPINIKTIAYWDLSNKGKVSEIDYVSLQPVNRQSLIDAANRIK